MMLLQQAVLTVLTKKKLPNIDVIRVVGGKVPLIPVVNSNGTTYAIVVSIPEEKYGYI
jgi:hypothetical protein